MPQNPADHRRRRSKSQSGEPPKAVWSKEEFPARPYVLQVGPKAARHADLSFPNQRKETAQGGIVLSLAMKKTTAKATGDACGRLGVTLRISPGVDRFYFAVSDERTVYRYDYDRASGAIGSVTFGGPDQKTVFVITANYPADENAANFLGGGSVFTASGGRRSSRISTRLLTIFPPPLY